MQTRKGSLFETCINIGIGWVVAMATQIIVFPWFDIHISLSTNFQISLIFTVVAIIRGYIIRRVFNKVDRLSFS